jgi:HK97 family phage portal protein
MNLLLGWLGRKIGLTDGAFWGAYFGGETWTGKPVTPQGAMKLSAWFAGVRLTAQTIASLPGSMYERNSSGDKVPVTQHDMHWMLHDSPNADQTAMEFWEGQGAGLAIVGNAYAEKVFNGAGDVIALNTMPFETTRPQRQADGSLRYPFMDRGKAGWLPEEKVFHTRGFGTGGDLGLSPVAAAGSALSGALATEEASAKMFGKGMRAAGFMLSPTTLTTPQRDQLHKNVIDPITGPDGEGAVGVLEAGFKWQPANIPPKDAEMILSRRFNVDDVCRWLGIPPILVGHAGEGQTMWGTGVEQIMLAWLTLGLRPYLVRIEQSIRKRLIAPADQRRLFWEFNIEGLLRGDSAARGEFYSKLFQVGAINPNLIASKENLPKPNGGEQYFVNSTYVPIEEAGQLVRSLPTPAADPGKPSKPARPPGGL